MLNKRLLKNLIALIQIDPQGYNPFGFRRFSRVPGKNTPVNLIEHLCHLTGFDYLSHSDGACLEAAAYALRGPVLVILDPVGWPKQTRLAARQAVNLGDTDSLVAITVEYLRSFLGES